jgi:hypothetical protein
VQLGASQVLQRSRRHPEEPAALFAKRAAQRESSEWQTTQKCFNKNSEDRKMAGRKIIGITSLTSQARVLFRI